jgi:GDP-L-fucose synthase
MKAASWSSVGPPPVLEVQTVTVSAADGLPEVQTVSLTADAADLSGAFTLSFKGQTTGEIKWDATKPVGQPARMLDGAKAWEQLNWGPKTAIQDGLESTIKWYSEYRSRRNG